MDKKDMYVIYFLFFFLYLVYILLGLKRTIKLINR